MVVEGESFSCRSYSYMYCRFSPGQQDSVPARATYVMLRVVCAVFCFEGPRKSYCPTSPLSLELLG